MEGWEVRSAASGFQRPRWPAVRAGRRRARRHDARPRRHGRAAAAAARRTTCPCSSSPRRTRVTTGRGSHRRRGRLRHQAVQPRRGRRSPARADAPRRHGVMSEDAEPILRVADLTLNEDSHEVERAGDADRADRDRVRTAALPHAQPAPRRVEGADPRPRLELRLRRALQRRRALHLVPAQEDRRRARAADPHGARRRLHDQGPG